MSIPANSPALVITALVRHDHDPEESYVTLLEHPPGLDVEAALRAAVADYAAHAAAGEPDGWHRFNWGDALSEIPPAVFARHGLRVLDILLPTITVEQNELLLARGI